MSVGAAAPSAGFRLAALPDRLAGIHVVRAPVHALPEQSHSGCAALSKHSAHRSATCQVKNRVSRKQQLAVLFRHFLIDTARPCTVIAGGTRADSSGLGFRYARHMCGVLQSFSSLRSTHRVPLALANSYLRGDLLRPNHSCRGRPCPLRAVDLTAEALDAPHVIRTQSFYCSPSDPSAAAGGKGLPYVLCSPWRPGARGARNRDGPRR